MSLSKRSVVNVNFLGEFHYAFINHFLNGDGSNSPVGSAYSTTSSTWMQLIDSDGWPNNSGATEQHGGSIRVPDPSNFAGPYVLTWDGDGTVAFGGATWTVTTGSSSNYTENSNGNYTNTTGSKPRIILTVSGFTNPALIQLYCTSNNPAHTAGRWLKNIQFYRLEDEADLQAGKLFRSGFKQPFVAMNPAAIRVMNWSGGSASTNIRWENRNKPSIGGFAVGANFVASPPYGVSSGTNTVTVSSVTGTPASMTHGEVATFRIGGNSTGNYVSVTSVTNANPGVVTTDSAHGFSTGDRVYHQAQNNGMPNLHRLPVTITVISSTSYSIGLDTTTWGTYTIPSDGGGPHPAVVCQYITLNVGGRGEYPVVMLDGKQPVASYGNLTAHSYQTCFFDKTLSAITNGSGSIVTPISDGGTGGVWLTVGPNGGGHSGEVPIEYLVALCNEINAMSVAQGISSPVGLWVNVPHGGISKGDPDYSTASDWAYNLVQVALSGNTVSGVSYAGLTSAATLYVEYGNENWNTGGGFWGTAHQMWRSYMKWPAGGQTNLVDVQALRSIQMVNSIKDALPTHTFPGDSRIKLILGIQPYGSTTTFFAGPNQGDPNYNKCFGTTVTNDGGYFYVGDSLNTAATAAIYQHDAVCLAPYIDFLDTYLTGGFPTDASNYSTAPSTSLANAVSNLTGAGGYIEYYTAARNRVTAGISAVGKDYIEYEGGQNWELKTGQGYGSITLTSTETTFLQALTKSTQWRDAQLNYFAGVDSISNAGMPALYITTAAGDPLTSYDPRWAYAWPDSYAGGVEGQGLGNSATLTTGNNPTWVGIAARNQAINDAAVSHHGGKGLRNF